MESTISQLRDVVAETAFVSPEKKTRKGLPCILLQEAKNEDSQLLLINVPDDIVVLKGDSFMPLLLEKTEKDGRHYRGTSFFRYETGASKRADFILLDVAGRKVVFLELKSSKETEEYIQAQLVGAHAVLDYVRRVVAHHHGLRLEEFIGKGFSLRFAGICKIGYALRKRTTKFQISGRGDSAQNFLRISGTSELHYHMLCGRSAS